MKRILVLTTLLAALLAAPSQAPAASAAAWKGVVVATDAKRGTVAVASANGSVRTVRVANARALRIGQRLSLRGVVLADGTFTSSSVAAAGRAKTTRLKAVVIRNQAAQKRLLVSAGGSTFAIRRAKATRALASSSDSGPRPGDRIDATLSVAGATPEATSVSTVGRLGVLEVEGILTKAAAGSIELVVAKAGFVTLALPAGFTLPAGVQVLDEVRVHVAVGTTGTLTVLAIRGDDDRDDDRVDVDEDDGEVEVKGRITALSGTSISVSPSAAAAAVTCALRKPLTGFAVGQFVELECVASGAAGGLVLKKIEHEDDDDDDDDDDDHDDDDDDDDDNSGPGGGG